MCDRDAICRQKFSEKNLSSGVMRVLYNDMISCYDAGQYRSGDGGHTGGKQQSIFCFFELGQ